MKTQMKSTALAFMIGALPIAASAKSLAIDPAASTIKWVGKKVTGQHNGTVNVKSGEVELDQNTIKGGQFEIDMASIKVLDITDKDNNAKLTGHLKSDDFFSVEKYPTSTFKITSVKPKGKSHEVTGDLTIKGVTQSVTFPATVEVKGDKASAKGKAKIDRTKYNVRYGSGKFFDNLGDKMIYDDFEIELDLKTK